MYPSSEDYARKFARYFTQAIDREKIRKKKIEEIGKEVKENFYTFADYISAQGKEEKLGVIVHGDLEPHNMLGLPNENRSLIDPDVRFSSSMLDVAYLFENPTFDDLNLDKQKIIEITIEKWKSLQDFLKLELEKIKEWNLQELMVSYHVCGLYNRIRNFEITKWYKETKKDKYCRLIKNEPTHEKYVEEGLKNAKKNLKY
ncbi:MAG: hypothetical protein NZ889_02535 [Candidatus Pacearchaeota archaeon]|nr:hypothetical protein [Candidatus Pacearchaeota archaeon]